MKAKILEFLVKSAAAMPYIAIVAATIWIVSILIRL